MTQLPFFGFSLYQMFHLFCFWSFIGWCIEVCYMTLQTGEYQNRGFLNMPICPIYGFGVLMVVIFFRPINHTIILLFLVTGTLCTCFELLVGLGMEKIFHARWWDYSMEKFNYKGMICLKVSILWGIGCVLVIRVVEPMVEKLINAMPVELGFVLIIVLSALIATDLGVSLATIIKLNERLCQIDEISKLMLKSSVKIGENLANETNEIRDRYDRLKESKPIAEIRERYEKLINTRDIAAERLLKAFPDFRSLSYSESLDKIRSKLNSHSLANRHKDDDKIRVIDNADNCDKKNEQ